MSYMGMNTSEVLIVDERNERLKLLRYSSAEICSMQKKLDALAAIHSVSKVIIYAQKSDISVWEGLGYHFEGIIDGFDQGCNAYMLSRFLTEQRATSSTMALEDEIVQFSLSKQGQLVLPTLSENYTIRQGTEADVEELARLYGMVFATYPTPMNEEDYIRKTMREETHYFLVETCGQIVCAASAEVSRHFGSAELTDCATHPDFLGQGLLMQLFPRLEEKMQEQGIFYLYTLTRAQSHAMNITAAKQGYSYRGRLVNNCRIFSGYENMNIWVKPLQETKD